jgi:hypothetical protein
MRTLLLVPLLAGCTLYFGDGTKDPVPDDPPPSLSPAERAWVEQALPVLKANCISCHAVSDPGISFLAGDTVWEMRQNILASDVVNLDVPQSSRILTKGAHQGPAMTASQASDLLEWLVAERDER